MAQGKVKWFNRERGYGFIVTDEGQDVFVHRTALKEGGKAQTLKEGDSVSFDIAEGDRGPKAVHVLRSEPDRGEGDTQE
jgi:CspA family cold shock protein